MVYLSVCKKGFLVANTDSKLASKAARCRPNPNRVRAGRLNRLKRQGLTPAGRERLRQAALRNRPWRFATGPRTPEGKARVAANAKAGQQGPKSVRAWLSPDQGLLVRMRRSSLFTASRSNLSGSNSPPTHSRVSSCL